MKGIGVMEKGNWWFVYGSNFCYLARSSGYFDSLTMLSLAFREKSAVEFGRAVVLTVGIWAVGYLL